METKKILKAILGVFYEAGGRPDPHGDGELRWVGAGEPQDLGHARDPAGRGARDPLPHYLYGSRDIASTALCQ